MTTSLFSLRLQKIPEDAIYEKVTRAAEILGITDYLLRKPRALSGGQRERVAIGRAMVRDSKVFLMDEPLSNLDAKLRNQMRAEIILLRQKLDTTFIYVTHDQTEAMTLGDRIVIMKDGFIMQVGTPEVSSEPEEYVDENRLAASAADTGLCRVFYEIFTGSFSNSDGDGIGDLRGIINRLDYLNDGDPDSGKSLGIGGIWLTPVFASPSYRKYDVMDYYSVDPDFGTMSDMEELIAECHARDVLLILNMPVNHSSSLNEWFLKFSEARRSGNTDDPYYSFYSCRSDEEAAGGAGLCPLAGTDWLYECNFSQDKPEFDFDDPAVREQMLDIARFWLDKGVDGFRFDAAKYIYYGNNGECVDFWSEYMVALREIKPDIYTVAEVWDGDGITGKYTKCMNCFNFTCAQAEGLISGTARHGDANSFTRYIDKHIDYIRSMNEDAFPVLFVANHDTDRAAGFLTAASGYMQMAANLYLLSPGSPLIYYGEEIGLRGSHGGASTDANRRAAMLWGGRHGRKPGGLYL